DQVISFEEKITFPYLTSFCGEYFQNVNPDSEYLIPYKFFTDLTESLKTEITVNCIKMNIGSGVNVLLPKSQDTTELFKTALDGFKDKSMKKIIDMGCGSGILTLMADEIFNNSEIFFSDILPEAIASTLWNIEKNKNTKFNKKGDRLFCETENNFILCCGNGDLFEKIDDKFDIIIFNSPWIDAISHNRSELALNDKNQKTLERFLMQAKHRLNNNGNILLAFSDNGGDTAVDRLNELITENHFHTDQEFFCRIQSHQSGRKWMKIFVKILTG
ncbi:MAG: methyltransferase, partial [Candidatus Delongbacteria bacterium]|nr:methyltransferase [Candidatus Delongbacteria bacterium]MCG2760334.1 methyltransferase [Candidatus Delongbacteria bacterium]